MPKASTRVKARQPQPLPAAAVESPVEPPLESPRNAAEPLPDSTREARAPSVHFLQRQLLADVQVAGLASFSTIYEIEHDVLLKRGERLLCPRDGRPGAAYVHTLSGEDNVGIATHMLSHAWGHPVCDVVAALTAWQERHGLESTRTYVWLSFLCDNLHRRHEVPKRLRAPTPEELVERLSSRIQDTGCLLVMLGPWPTPLFVERSWCLLELHLAAQLLGERCLDVVVSPRDEEALSGAVQSGCGVQRALDVLGSTKIECSFASSPEERCCIMLAVEQSVGRQQFNASVSGHLQELLRGAVCRHAGWNLARSHTFQGSTAAQCIGKPADGAACEASRQQSIAVATPPRSERCAMDSSEAEEEEDDDHDDDDEEGLEEKPAEAQGDGEPEVAREKPAEAQGDDEPEVARESEARDPEWEKAFRIVDETEQELSRLMTEARTAPKARQQILMVRKQRLTNAPRYTAARRYLEDPAAERERMEFGGLAIEKVFFDMPTEPLEDSTEVFQMCCASERLQQPVEALLRAREIVAGLDEYEGQGQQFHL